MPWLTVGIAVYNNDKYIKAAITSVLNQIDERVNLVIVNDGSKDNSLSVIHETIGEYPQALRNQITVIDQPNSGVSKVRNLAITKATTPYVTFLDGDDYWLDNYYSSLLAMTNNGTSSDADIIEYDTLEHREAPGTGRVEKKHLHFNPVGPYRGEITFEQLQKLFIRSKWYVWTRVYKKELFDGLLFPEHLKFEDMMLVPQLYLRARRIISTPEALIAYRVNLGGQVANPSEQVIRDVESIIEIHLNLARQLEDTAKKKLLVLLACQSALYYKIATNMTKGYIGSIADINRVLAKIRPLKREYGVDLPFKTQLLFISPLASNFYTYVKTRKFHLPRLTPAAVPHSKEK